MDWHMNRDHDLIGLQYTGKTTLISCVHIEIVWRLNLILNDIKGG
jgi:hypothetical protein